MKNSGCPWGVGSKTQTNIVFEDEYGKLPEDAASKTINMPFNTNGVASSQNSTNPATIRGNRNPVEPILGNNDVTGDITVPLDYTACGFWFAAAMGMPTTTKLAEGKYQHIFKLQDTLPSFTLEKAFPGIGQYILEHGCKVSKISFSFGGDGELTATVSVMGSKEEIRQEAMGKDIMAPNFDRANNFQGKIKIDNEDMGKVLTFSLDVDNGLDGDTFSIGQQGFREAICEGLATISGTLEAFFKDAFYLEKAEKSVETSMELILVKNENQSLSIKMPEVKFARTSPGIDGPAGIKQSISYNAFYQDNEEASALVITLVNNFRGYDMDALDRLELSVPEGAVYGKQVTDLSENLAYALDGTVTGKLKKVTGYTGFDNANVGNQEGYFLPFKAQLPEGTVTATVTVVGGTGLKKSIKDEPCVVARLGLTPEEAKARYVSIEYSDGSITRVLNINTSKLTYEGEK